MTKKYDHKTNKRNQGITEVKIAPLILSISHLDT